jgi:hypothetical protein
MNTMHRLRQLLLRWAPLSVIELVARRVLRDLPGVGAIDALQVETAAGRDLRLTVRLRVAAGHASAEVSRRVALAIFERLPPTELRVVLVNPSPPEEGGQVVPLMPV